VSFRSRLFVALLGAVLLPLALLAYGVRREMTARLTGEYEHRVEALVAVIQADLAEERRSVGTRLARVGQRLAADGRFRLAAVQGAESERPWLLDAAGDAMRLSGLAMLQVEDGAGRILSSGHFRNEYDRLAPGAAALLAAAPDGAALLRTRAPDRAFLALARVDSFEVGGARFFLIGGNAIDSAAVVRLAPDPDMAVSLVTPAETLGAVRAAAGDGVAAGGRVVREFTLPYIDAVADPVTAADTARFVVAQRLATLQALRRGVDRWFLLAFAATGVGALLFAAWLAGRVSRPLSELARKTEAIDLERLDQDFATDRTDEIGDLSRLLGAMTERLRAGAVRLREAERRATTGDLARQVTHDIKNGLAPIRHVVRHLAQVARDEPAELPAIFAERQGTLDSSVAYLETLARNYARLSPSAGPARCDANAVVRQVARGAERAPATLHLQLDERLPAVRADEVVLRRILENLVGNAIDSLGSRPGAVTVSTTMPTEAGADGSRPPVRVVVADTGRGMSRTELDQAFDDFYTTKAGGTGLGLSVVRRLVADLGGTLRVETEPGAGSRFFVDLPAADGSS
jgi:signal transduction histidine kinase